MLLQEKEMLPIWETKNVRFAYKPLCKFFPNVAMHLAALKHDAFPGKSNPETERILILPTLSLFEESFPELFHGAEPAIIQA